MSPDTAPPATSSADPAPRDAAVRSREWDAIDESHRDFAASILALVSLCAHHFMMRDIIKAEDLRDLLEAYLAKPGSVAPRQLLEQVETFIRTRDAACFSRTIEIARGHGRLPAEGHGRLPAEGHGSA